MMFVVVKRRSPTTFVMLADTLVDDFDVVELLDSLAGACVEVLGATAAGLLLNDQKGNLAVVASSSEESRLLEVCQLQSDEGPCLDCLRSGASVISGDLTEDRDRWPTFVAAALSAGFQSVSRFRCGCVPRPSADSTFSARPSAEASEADQRLAQAFADVATIGILQQRSAHRSSLLGRAAAGRAEQPDHGGAGERRARRAARGEYGHRFRCAAAPRPRSQSGAGRRGPVGRAWRYQPDHDHRAAPGLSRNGRALT